MFFRGKAALKISTYYQAWRGQCYYTGYYVRKKINDATPPPHQMQDKNTLIEKKQSNSQAVYSTKHAI